MDKSVNEDINYSNNVSVSVNDIEVMFEFKFINPHSKKSTLVSRVIMPISALASIVEMLKNLQVANTVVDDKTN